MFDFLFLNNAQEEAKLDSVKSASAEANPEANPGDDEMAAGPCSLTPKELDEYKRKASELRVCECR